MIAARHQHYRIGTASWTDPTLLQAGFYPAAARTAEARLRYYAEHFDTVEVDSSYYALPSERNAALWAERTPATFHFNIKAFALLTGHAAETRALPAVVREQLPAALRGAPRVQEVPEDVRRLCFDMFHRALEPLRRAHKLGCVLLQFPPWFGATPAHEAYVERCGDWLAGNRLAVEFRHPSWFDGTTARTLAFLREREFSLVCLDAPAAGGIARPPYAATADVAYVRLHGRNRQAWFQRQATAAQRFKYLYDDDELRTCATRIRGSGDDGGVVPRTVYVIFNNCYADYGVRNAITMQRLLGE